MSDLRNISEQELENLLRSLPLQERSKEKERLFYARLKELAKAREQEAREEKWAGEAAPAFGAFGVFGGLRRVFAFGTLALLALFIATVGFSLSPKVTRGHFLYPVKQTEERGELAFARNPLSRVNAHMRFAGRRLDELEKLFKGNPELFRLISLAHAHLEFDDLDPRIHETLDDYYRENSKATEEIAKLEEPKTVTKALESVETAQTKHVKKLENLLPNAAGVAKPLIAEVITVVEEHQAEIVEKKIEVLRRAEEGEKKVTIRVKPVEKVAEEVKEKAEKAPAAAAVEQFEKREERAQEELARAKALFSSLKSDLERAEGETDDVKRFSKFTEEKLLEAEKAFEDGDFGKARGLSRALEGMTERFRGKEFEKEAREDKKVFPSIEEAEKYPEEKKKEIMEKMEKRKETQEAKRKTQEAKRKAQKEQQLEKEPAPSDQQQPEEREEPFLEPSVEPPDVYTPQVYRNPFRARPAVKDTKDGQTEVTADPNEESTRQSLIQHIQELMKDHEAPADVDPAHLAEKSLAELQKIYRMAQEAPKTEAWSAEAYGEYDKYPYYPR